MGYMTQIVFQLKFNLNYNLIFSQLWLLIYTAVLFKELSLFGILKFFFVQKCPYTSMFIYKQN